MNTPILSQILNLLPDLITSPIQYLTSQSYKFINFILQSIFFSTSVLNITSVILIILGITQTTTLLNSKYSYIINIILGVAFLRLHIFEFSNQHHRIHEFLNNVSAFYVAFCCVQGCVYIKQKIDPYYTQNMFHFQKSSQIFPQLFLITATILTTAFFIILWYNIKISEQIPQLHNNNKLLSILLLSVFTIYVVSGFKGVSLFLPAIVSCLCVFLPIGIKIIMCVYQWGQIQSLHIPVHVIPIILISSQGRYKHISHSSSTLREKHKNMDKQYIEQKVKSNRIIINNMYWGALGYVLYSLLHGSSINIEYMVIAVYVVLVGKGSIA